MKTTLNITYTYYEPYGRFEYHGQWRLFGVEVEEIVFSSLLVQKNHFYLLEERKW